MRIGLFTPLVTPIADREYVMALGKEAEDRGFHSLWIGEHIALVDDPKSPYPYSPDGKMPAISGSRGFPELFTTLAFLAACTTQVRLGSGTCVLPIRNPVLTAKEAATIDWLSQGRFDLGVGLGWLLEEYDVMASPGSIAAGVPTPTSSSSPTPGGTPEQITERLGVIEPFLNERGRKLQDLEIMVCPYNLSESPEEIEQYRDVGVTQILLTVMADDPSKLIRKLDQHVELLAAVEQL